MYFDFRVNAIPFSPNSVTLTEKKTEQCDNNWPAYITHSRVDEERKTETRILNGRHMKYKIDILREYGKRKVMK